MVACACECNFLKWPEVSIRSPAAGGTGSCEPCDGVLRIKLCSSGRGVCALNLLSSLWWVWVLWIQMCMCTSVLVPVEDGRGYYIAGTVVRGNADAGNWTQVLWVISLYSLSILMYKVMISTTSFCSSTVFPVAIFLCSHSDGFVCCAFLLYHYNFS